MPLIERTDDELIWAMQTWIEKTPNLDLFERELLENLRNTLVLNGREDFIELGRSFMTVAAPALYRAREKALAVGLGAWPSAEQPVV